MIFFKIKKHIFITTFFLVIVSSHLSAQNDSLIVQTVNKGRILDPARATMLAATLPGLGQIYNRKIWKIPLAYAGFIFVGYLSVRNSDRYTSYVNAYRDLTDNITETKSYTFRNFGVPAEQFDKTLNSENFNPATEDWVKTQLINGIDYYRKKRNMSYVFIGIWYLLTILDANVDANMIDYDVSENLNIAIEPMPPSSIVGSTVGLGMKISF